MCPKKELSTSFGFNRRNSTKDFRKYFRINSEIWSTHVREEMEILVLVLGVAPSEKPSLHALRAETMVDGLPRVIRCTEMARYQNIKYF